MSGALVSPKVHNATTAAVRRFQSSAPAYVDDKVHSRSKDLAPHGIQLPINKYGLYSARVTTPAASAADDEDDGDSIMDDYDLDFPGLASDVAHTQNRPVVPRAAKDGIDTEALRRSKAIYNPQDDQADADAEALGVVPYHEGRRWQERRMRLARYVQFVDGPSLDDDDVPAPLAAYLDLEFKRDGAVVLAPVVRGGRGEEGLGSFLRARPGPRGVELRKRREVVGGDDGVGEVGAADDYGGGRDVADLFYHEIGAVNAAMRPGKSCVSWFLGSFVCTSLWEVV